MIRCLLAQWWTDEYLDGTLERKRVQWMETHLRECSRCAQELAWRRSLHQALGRPSTVAPSSREMWQDFQHRLAQRRSPAHPARLAWRWLTPATAALAAGIVGAFLWWNTPRLQPEETARPLVATAPSQEVRTVERETRHGAGGQRIAQVTAPPNRPSSAAPTRRPKPSSARPAPGSVPPVLTRPDPIRQELQPSPPQSVASIAYAEVRDAQGQLVSQVFLQTIYDQNGQPRTVQIEMNTPTRAEVDTDVQADDSTSLDRAPRGDPERPQPATDAPLGISD